MKVLLTGVTGLLGGALLDLLLAEGHEVRCLVREGSPRASRLDVRRAELARGDAADPRALSRALSGVAALLHVAGIEYAPPVVEAARRAGGGRLVVVSSTSAHSAYASRSGPKLRMEGLVRASELDYTIVRPGGLTNDPGKGSVRLGENISRGQVPRDDVAAVLVAVLDSPNAIGRTVDLIGGDTQVAEAVAAL